jgi:hypothetical protein
LTDNAVYSCIISDWEADATIKIIYDGGFEDPSGSGDISNNLVYDGGLEI